MNAHAHICTRSDYDGAQAVGLIKFGERDYDVLAVAKLYLKYVFASLKRGGIHNPKLQNIFIYCRKSPL